MAGQTRSSSSLPTGVRKRVSGTETGSSPDGTVASVTDTSGGPNQQAAGLSFLGERGEP